MEMGWDGGDKRFQISIPLACGLTKEKSRTRETPDPEATFETPPPMQSASPHAFGEGQFYCLLKIKKSGVEEPCHFLWLPVIQDRSVVLLQCLLGLLLSLSLKYWLFVSIVVAVRDVYVCKNMMFAVTDRHPDSCLCES